MKYVCKFPNGGELEVSDENLKNIFEREGLKLEEVDETEKPKK